MFARSLSRSLCPTLLSAVLALGLVGVALANDFTIQGTGGFSTSTGDVDNNLIGKGAVFSGRALVALSDQFLLGGGAHLAFYGGRSVPGFESVDFTDAGFRFNLDGGGLFYLLPKSAQLRPYIGGFLGWGILGWSYSPLATQATLVDSDAIGFLYFAPEVGLNLALSESVDLTFGARGLLSAYGDKTSENFVWDLDGGHFIEVFAGVGFSL